MRLKFGSHETMNANQVFTFLCGLLDSRLIVALLHSSFLESPRVAQQCDRMDLKKFLISFCFPGFLIQIAENFRSVPATASKLWTVQACTGAETQSLSTLILRLAYPFQ